MRSCARTLFDECQASSSRLNRKKNGNENIFVKSDDHIHHEKLSTRPSARFHNNNEQRIQIFLTLLENLWRIGIFAGGRCSAGQIQRHQQKDQQEKRRQQHPGGRLFAGYLIVGFVSQRERKKSIFQSSLFQNSRLRLTESAFASAFKRISPQVSSPQKNVNKHNWQEINRRKVSRKHMLHYSRLSEFLLETRPTRVYVLKKNKRRTRIRMK